MLRFVAQTILCVSVVISAARCKDLTVHGFVTALNSPTNFEVDEYKVTRSNTVLLDLDKQEGDKSLETFKPEDLRVGTELEIKGDYDEASGGLKAWSIRVFTYDTLTVKRTALLEKLPSLTKADSG